jgi:hypothetical protein
MSRAIALRDTVPLDCFDDVLVEPFIPNSSVIALDIGILLRLARLDILEHFKSLPLTYSGPLSTLMLSG